MARTFDPGPLLSFLPSYWRDYYEDKDQLIRYWESLIRIMDDEWAQIEQANDASNIDTVPTFIYHTYLYRMLTGWGSLGAIHGHFRKDFRAAAGQTIFYLGDWPSLSSLRVFLQGKEVDSSSGGFIVTYDQDATQPGTNPAGARLIFSAPRSLNDPISVFSDKEMFKTDIEVPAGGLLDVPFTSDVDHLSTKIVLKKWNVTSRLTLEASKFYWKAYTTATNQTDTRVFRRGEIYEVVDGGVVQTISVTTTTREIPISSPINPLTAKVYRVLNFDITSGKVTLDGSILRASNQHFPVSIQIQASDFYAVASKTPTTLTDAIDFEKEFDGPSFKALMLGGDIHGGYSVESSGVSFSRSFSEGVVLSIEAPYSSQHGHAEYSTTVTSPTNLVSVDQAVAPPFDLSSGLLERPDYPIMVFLDGVLLPPDMYTFPSNTSIQLVSGLFPSGSRIYFHYAIEEGDPAHLHIYQRTTLANPGRAVQLTQPLDPSMPYRVSVLGVTIDDPDMVTASSDGEFIRFTNPVAGGSVIRVWGAIPSYLYSHDIDIDIVRAAYMQNGIDELSTEFPGGWTIQLVWDEGFTIDSGVLKANEIFEDAWFVDAYVDEETGYSNFGKLIGFYRENSDEYIRILRALFSGSYMGSQPSTVESLVNIALGSEYFIDPLVVDSISGTQVRAGGETYELDPEVPPRVSPGVQYGKYHAISAFAEIDDLWEIPDDDPNKYDFISIAAEQFSSDYRFARFLDSSVPTIFEGDDATYDTENFILEDTEEDFETEEVRPGDLVWLSPQLGSPVYGRVEWVEQTRIKVVTNLTPVQIGYGQDILGYGSWAYGGSSRIITIDDYKIWNRRTDRIDEWEHLDKARAEDMPVLAARILPILRNFVFPVQVRWKGLRSAQALEDVGLVLHRTKPEDTEYLMYSRVYEEDGLQDEFSGTIADVSTVVTVVPDWAFVGMGVVGGQGQISPNVGSFIPSSTTVYPGP